MNSPLYQRFTEASLLEALQDTPMVLIRGSRQCEKTTLAQQIGGRLGYHYITLDDDNQLQAAKYDPVGFVHGLPEKVILDDRPCQNTKLSAVRWWNRFIGMLCLAALLVMVMRI